MNAMRWLGLSILSVAAAACSSSPADAPTSSRGGATTNSPNGGATARGGTSSSTSSVNTGGNNAQGGSSQGSSEKGGSAQGGSSQSSVQQGGSSQSGSAKGGSSAKTSSSPAGGAATTSGGANAGGSSTKTGNTVVTSGGSVTTNGGSSVTNQGGTNAAGGTANGGNGNPGGSSAASGAPAQGGSGTAGTSAATGNGFFPKPNSQNTSNFDVGAWYTKWKDNYYKDCGSTGRIVNGQGSDTAVSEGIAYGMLLAVGNDDRTVFDKLWAFYNAHLDPNGLMNWTITGCSGSGGTQYAATDAEEDAAMALVQADAKWGGYADDAKALIAKIKKFEVSLTTNPTYLRPGDADNNGGKGEGVVNPSYFSPGYWHVWAIYTNDDSWNKLATDAYAMLAKFQKLTISNSTNLVPDWGKSDGTNPNGGGYYYDACRTPWRVAIDYVWFGTPEAKTFLTNICSYVDGKGGVASTQFDKNSAFLGAFALAGMAVSQEKADSYLNTWLSAQMDDTPYFQGSLRGIYLLLANNKFPKGI